MDEPLESSREVTFAPTFEDVLAAYRLAHRRERKLSVAILALLAGSAVATALADHPAFALLLGAPSAVLVYLVLGGLLRRLPPARVVRKIYRQQVSLRSETTMAWDADRLHWRSDRGEAHSPWRDFIGRREDEATILLYASDALWFFIPKRILDPAQRASVAPLLASVPQKR